MSKGSVSAPPAAQCGRRKAESSDAIETGRGRDHGNGSTAAGLVSITIPVYNEADQLELSVSRLVDSLDRMGSFAYEIIIADNGSTDSTPWIAERLERSQQRVRLLRLRRKGRGWALRNAWQCSSGEVLAYMDADLSTDLFHVQQLVQPILSGTADVTFGSRLDPRSVTIRGWKREILSRGYNLLLRLALQARFSDAQCGFKALSRAAASGLLDSVENNNWFFDTELLMLAQNRGLRLLEIPVRWTDDPGSSVHLAATVREDLLGVARLWWRRTGGGAL